jgi:chromosomal replication initiator protein
MDAESADFSAVWGKVTHQFTNGTQQQRAWLGLTRPVGLVEDTALLAAPNEYAREYLDVSLRPAISIALSEELGRDIQVALTVTPREDAAGLGLLDDFGDETDEDVDTVEDLDPHFDAPADHPGWAPVSTGFTRPTEITPAPSRGARLNARYTFDTFVIGSSNRFSHAAAVAVAEAPARAYSPLFIYGDSGLGKTHLLHAIGNYSQRLYPGLRVRYVSSEEFTNDFINSLRDDKMQAFQARYREIDLLLIDDIQFLERAERTQEEFFHTFNTLHNANKQIVISSDRPPRQLLTVEDRLRTRFEWGLITDVLVPDLETRIAILRKKAAQDGLNPPPEVLQYIAERSRATSVSWKAP